MPNITMQEIEFLEYYVGKHHNLDILPESMKETEDRDYESVRWLFDRLYKRQRRINEYQRERKYK